MNGLKSLSELPEKEAFELVKGSEKLRERFSDYLIDTEMYHVSELITTLRSSLRDYSVGVYSPITIQVGNEEDFVACVGKMVEDYGTDVDVERAYNGMMSVIEKGVTSDDEEWDEPFENLRDAVELFFRYLCSYIEDLSFNITHGDMDKSVYLFELFHEHLEGVFVKEDGTLVEVKSI